jgi:hypothetical protein
MMKIRGWLGVQQLGTDTIINRITMYYDKRFWTAGFDTGNAQGEYRNYVGILDWYDGLDTRTTNLLSQSVSLFGSRELSEPTFDWIRSGSIDSSEKMAEYYAAVYALPTIIVTLDVPLSQYSDLEIFDIITLSHPGMPSFLGTTSNAVLPDYDNDETDIGNSHYWKRAKSYRMQIEGKQINFSPTSYPTLRLVCRVLINSNDPT